MCLFFSKMNLVNVAILFFSVLWNAKAFGYVKPLNDKKACQLIKNQY